MDVNATTAASLPTATLTCAWCRRDDAVPDRDDPRAIVGLCEDHVKRFLARVDDLLAACAASRKKESDVEVPPEASPAEGVAAVLRRHGGLKLCDACLAAELDCRAERVSREAARRDRSEFLRDHWRCARCGARGLVSRAGTRRGRILEDVAKAA